jgi:hypothetical protein
VFKGLKPTIYFREVQILLRKKNRDFRLIKPLSSLDIIFFAKHNGGGSARTEAAPSFMKGRCGGSSNTILVYVNH